MRRLLLIPAVALVLLGTPVLATAQGAPPRPTSQDIAVAPGATVSSGWTSAETPVGATLVGVRWNGDPAAQFTIETRDARGGWSPAQVSRDDATPDAGTADAQRQASLPGPDHASEPVWTGARTTAVRVRVDSGTASDVTIAAVDSEGAPAPGGSAGALAAIGPVHGSARYAFAAALFATALVLAAVALGWSPWRSRKLRRLAIVLAAGVAVLAGCTPAPSGGGYASAPAIVPRTQWGGDLPFVCSGGPVVMSHLSFAVVHHTAGGNSYGPGDTPAILRGIYTYHVYTNGYCDVAYNFFVDRYGQIFEGRWGGTTQPILGGHSGGFNSYSTGVAMVGDFTSSPIPAGTYDSLVRLLRWKLSIHRVDPAAGFTTVVASSPCNCQRWPPGTTVSFSNAIVTHRDVDYTSCPGDAAYSRLGSLRADVQAGIAFPP